jgi:hypothetical protein
MSIFWKESAIARKQLIRVQQAMKQTPKGIPHAPVLVFCVSHSKERAYYPSQEQEKPMQNMLTQPELIELWMRLPYVLI